VPLEKNRPFELVWKRPVATLGWQATDGHADQVSRLDLVYPPISNQEALNFFHPFDAVATDLAVHAVAVGIVVAVIRQTIKTTA